MIRLLILSAMDAWALIALRPDVARLAGDLARPRAWTLRVGLDAAAAELGGALVWLLSLWLAIGLLAALSARESGALGRLGERTARTVLPRSVHRLLAGAAGFGILLAPVAAGAATPTVTAPPAIAQLDAHAIAPVPAPTWPTAPAAPTAPTTPTAPTAPTAPGGSTQSTTAKTPASAPSSPEHVMVRPGDSLWLITARRLGPHAGAAAVAAQWPRWYAANRATIGPDPDLLLPGQVLHAPDQGAA